MFAHNLRVQIPQSNLISELSAFLNPTEHSGYCETSANSQQISGHSLQGPGMQLSICSTANFKSSLKILQKVSLFIDFARNSNYSKIFKINDKVFSRVVMIIPENYQTTLKISRACFSFMECNIQIVYL